MSLSPRGRFNPENPFPEGGVITPNVFPSPVHRRYGRLDLHDIIAGELPAVAPQHGWLRIVLGNNPDVDYTSPHLSESERKDRLGTHRKTLDIELLVESMRKIKRTRTSMNPRSLEVPAFDGQKLQIPEERKLMTATSIEQAIAFSGMADIEGSETPVSGVHFASNEEHGWLLMGEAPDAA